MMHPIRFVSLLVAGCLLAPGASLPSNDEPGTTVVSIEGEQFYLNGKPTYEGRTWNGHKIEGLLFNARLVQGIFDDLNPETRERFVYPDTKQWDPERNTNEFVGAMEDWHAHGLLAFTLNLQGGSPLGYGNKNWINSTFDPDGNLREAYMSRLVRILDKADELGMVVILGYFYFGQDQHLVDEAAVLRATDNITKWLLEKGYRNILIEINNETRPEGKGYEHEILTYARVHELIDRVQTMSGGRLLVSTSFNGGVVPIESVVEVADFVLLHGNGVHDPQGIIDMVEKTRALEAYSPMPIVFNEDDHFDFDKPMNNLVAATSMYASWGYFDFRMEGEGFEAGFQSVPVDWSIGSERKKQFFSKVKEITGY